VLFPRIAFLLSFCAAMVFAASSPAATLPVVGDIAAVLRRCGNPSSDTVAYDPSSRRMERILRYNYTGLTLRFQPAGRSWSFTSGTLDGQVASLHRLASSSHCLRDSLTSQSLPVIPATAQATAVPPPPAVGLQLSTMRSRELLGLGVLCLVAGMLVPVPRRFPAGTGLSAWTL
jgi:hypothetical protein